MPKFEITLNQNLYTTYIVEADNEDDAKDLVLEGNAENHVKDKDCDFFEITESYEVKDKKE